MSYLIHAHSMLDSPVIISFTESFFSRTHLFTIFQRVCRREIRLSYREDTASGEDVARAFEFFSLTGFHRRARARSSIKPRGGSYARTVISGTSFTLSARMQLVLARRHYRRYSDRIEERDRALPMRAQLISNYRARERE